MRYISCPSQLDGDDFFELLKDLNHTVAVINHNRVIMQVPTTLRVGRSHALRSRGGSMAGLSVNGSFSKNDLGISDMVKVRREEGWAPQQMELLQTCCGAAVT